MRKAQKTEVATLPEVKEEDGTAAPYWRRNLAVCVFGSFTTLVSLTLVVPFLPLYVEQLGVQGQASIAEWSGACFAAAFFTAGLVAPLWGKLADRYGRKLMLIRASPTALTLFINLNARARFFLIPHSLRGAGD